MEYVKTSRNGNTYKTLSIPYLAGDMVFILRNQKHAPADFFPVGTIWTREEAIKKINHFCK